MGMIGGGEGSMIGSIHRIAANLDGQIELVCGCFSSQYSVTLKTGKSLFLPENRIYETWKEMIEKESKLAPELRMDFVAIVTPNYLHFDPAMYALENGFHVMMDKPLTISLEQAKLLKAKVQQTGLLFGLTHTYTGYPMVKEARIRVRRGDLGTLRRIYGITYILSLLY
jgi:predicted dehydrogenase